MNYLAHILLSGTNEEIIIGNFIGDFVKGKSHEKLSPELQRGVLLHRFIDDFTDTHIKVKTDVKLMAKHIGRYAPIAVDVYYDFLLSKYWSNFNSQSIEIFCDDFYKIGDKYTQVMPERCRFMYGYMKRDNWLANYQYSKGIERTLLGLSKRTKFDSGLEKAFEFLSDNQNVIENNFEEFFRELQLNSKSFLNG